MLQTGHLYFSRKSFTSALVVSDTFIYLCTYCDFVLVAGLELDSTRSSLLRRPTTEYFARYAPNPLPFPSTATSMLVVIISGKKI